MKFGYDTLMRAALVLISRQRRADLETLARLIDAGQLTPVIGKTYPLHQAPDAMRRLQAGDARGKPVLTVTGPDEPPRAPDQRAGAREPESTSPPWSGPCSRPELL
jgi:hypothetical protein